MELKRRENENEESYVWRLGLAKDSGQLDMSWSDIADLVNTQFRSDESEYRSEAAYRKPFQQAKRFMEAGVFGSGEDKYLKELEVQKRELERMKIQYRDQRNAWQKQNFADARVEQKLDYLEEALTKQGAVNFKEHLTPMINSENDLLIQLSDLHIGQCFSSVFGVYNSDIAKVRLNKYLANIIEVQKMHNCQNAYVLLQGDIISGNIRKSIQVTNRENVIDQIKIAVELITSFCYELTKYFTKVKLYNVSGNHSRIDKEEDAIHDDRLDDLIGWDVGRTLSHIENFCDKTGTNFDTGIAVIDIRGNTYLGVHGDFDPYTKSGLSDLVMCIGFKPYAVLYGHLHHCSYDDIQGVKMIRSGSLAGAGDQYTLEKRIIGDPLQMLTVCNSDGVVCCYPVSL